MSETLGQRLYRYRVKSGLSTKQICQMLDSSLSMLYYVEAGQRGFPMRWLDRLPPEVTVPILEDIIAERHARIAREYGEIIELERKLGAMKKSRPGETVGTERQGNHGFVDDFSYSDLDRV